jgi:hypothetical protein
LPAAPKASGGGGGTLAADLVLVLVLAISPFPNTTHASCDRAARNDDRPSLALPSPFRFPCLTLLLSFETARHGSAAIMWDGLFMLLALSTIMGIA